MIDEFTIRCINESRDQLINAQMHFIDAQI